MEKYIIDLLDNNVRVVLPDLGAFIVKQRKPLKIIFNEFLKYNDGLLIEYVAKTENINKDEATKKVTEYVDNVKSKLEKNEKINITGLGIIKKDPSGNISFSLEGEPEKEAEAPVSKPDKKEEKPKIVKAEKVEAEKETKKTVSKKEETKPVEPIAPKKEITKPEAEKKPVYQNKYTQKTSEDDKKKTWLWLAAALLAILIVILTLFINKNSSEITKKESPEPDISDTAALTEETAEPENIMSEEPDKNYQEIKPVTTSQGKRYYVIAGCFRIPGNADNYVIFLRKKGYPAENLGVFNGYHVVSFNSFASRKEAVNELNKIRGDFEAEAWLKKR